MPHPLRSARPFALGVLLAAPSLAVAQSGALAVDTPPYGTYAGTALPIAARWRAGAGTPELVDTLLAWRTSDSRSAWVGGDGLLYLERPGRVTITATRAGVSTQRTFQIVELPGDRLSLAATPAGLAPGAAFSLGARLIGGSRDGAGDARLAYGIAIRGSTPAATLDTAGRFVAAAPGGYTLLAAAGAVGARIVVPVGDAPATTPPLARHADRGDQVRELAVEQVGNYEAYVGTSIPLVARVELEPGAPQRAIAWTSDDPTTAWVDASGVVHFLARGSVSIAATVGGHRATRDFRVREPEAYRVLLRASGPSDLAAAVGDSVQIDGEAWVVGGGRLQHPRLDLAVWTADGAAVAPRVTITEDGVFVAHAPGTYTVMTTINGHASSVVVPVDAAPAAAR